MYAQSLARAEELVAKIKELELADHKMREEQIASGTLRKSDNNVSSSGVRQAPAPKRTATPKDDQKVGEWAWDPSAKDPKEFK